MAGCVTATALRLETTVLFGPPHGERLRRLFIVNGKREKLVSVVGPRPESAGKTQRRRRRVRWVGFFPLCVLRGFFVCFFSSPSVGMLLKY